VIPVHSTLFRTISIPARNGGGIQEILRVRLYIPRQFLLGRSKCTIHNYRHRSPCVHPNVPRSCFGYRSLIERLGHARDDDPKRAEESKRSSDPQWQPARLIPVLNIVRIKTASTENKMLHDDNCYIREAPVANQASI
jgi:hypothetical protein